MFELSVMLRGRLVATSRFDQDTVRIGRTPDNDVFIDNPVFSRSHAVIQRKGIIHVIQDLRTPNGTFLNGQRVTVANLNDGDRISIGKFTLVFSSREAAKPGSAAPAVKGGETLALDPRTRAEDLERNSQTRARLVLASHEEYPLQRDVFVVGSHRTCDLLAGGFFDKKIAFIARGHGGFELVNVAGKPLAVNGRPVEWQAWLRDGDEVDFGPLTAKFVLDRDEGVRHAPAQGKSLGESLSLAIRRSEQRSKLMNLLDRWFERHG